MTFDPAAARPSFLVLYDGPSVAGKITQLRWIHANVPAASRGPIELEVMRDQAHVARLAVDARSLPVLGNHRVRLELTARAGAIASPPTWRMLRHQADGVVFVADSQPERMEANLEWLEYVVADLAEREDGRGDRVAWAMMYNKRDLPGVVPMEAMRAVLNARGAPEFGGIARRGVGVFEALRSIVDQLVGAAPQR